MRTLTRITLIAGVLFVAGCNPRAAEEAAEQAAAEAEKQAQAAAEQAEQAADEAKQAAKVAEDEAAQALKGAEGATADALKQAEGAAGELGGKAEESLGALGQELGAAGQKASEALKGVEGGGELMTKFNELFTSASKTLSGVNNEATAQAAASKLEELSRSAENLKPLLENLPAEAKTAVTGAIEKSIPQLEALAKSVYAIPGVEAALKPKVDELMAKLTALTGKPPA